MRFDPKIKRKVISSDEGEYSGKLNILIAGFSRKNIVSIKQIAKAVEILPDFHLENLNVIRYDEHRFIEKIPRYFGYHHVFKRRVGGRYMKRSRGILIHPFEEAQDFYEVLYHEIGHFVYYHIIGHDLKHEWAMKLQKTRPHVTAYAKKNASEGFAESYMYYVLYKRKLKENRVKYKFIKKKVFKNFAPERLSRKVCLIFNK